MNNSRETYSFLTKDEHQISVRPLKPDDAHHLVDLFNHMGLESRYLRFNLGLKEPDPELVWLEAERLAQIDPEKDGAWLAFCDLPTQQCAAVGGARYMRLDGEMAEASLAVRDDMQNKGIGGELLRFLIEQARSSGIRKLVANVQRSNRPVWQLIKRSGLRISYESKGSSTEITAYLSEMESLAER